VIGVRVRWRSLAPWYEQVGWATLLLGLGGVGLARVWGPSLDKDFSLFYAAARQWVEHGQPGGLAWYQPFALRLLAPFGWLPPRAAGTLWVLGNLACLVGSAQLVGGRGGGKGTDRGWREELVALLVLLVPWLVEFHVNQLVPPILLLLLLAERALVNRSSAWAGWWLGLAILIKLSPAVFVLWLLLKRQWCAVAWTLAVTVALGPGLDTLTVGWEQAWQWQREWYGRVRWSGSAWTVLVAGSQCEYSNHAVAAVLRRLLYPTDSTPWFDVEVGGQTELVGRAPVNLVSLPLSWVVALWTASMLLGLVALVTASLRPGRLLGPERLRWEWALFALGMLWFLPVVRQYHYLFAYPLVSLLVGRLRRTGQEGGSSPWRSPAAFGLGVWIATMLFGAPRVAQEFGVPMLGMAALGVSGWVEIRRMGTSEEVGS
jgi:hypothetical protein